ncbi:MAG: putative porin [Pseudomonadota bacterium]
MRRALSCFGLALVPVFAHADDFDYQIDFSATQIDIDTTITSTFPGAPPSTFEDDVSVQLFSLGGTWFFNGLSDDTGPRAQAAFVDRASLLSLTYAHASGDADSSNISIAGRYVWKNSGWFVSGGYDDNDQGDFIDVSRLTIGVGKYIGETTSIAFSLIEQEIEIEATTLFDSQSNSEAGAVLSFEHLGDLGSQWQYATSVSASNESFNDASGRYVASFSLYPNRDSSFDAEVTGELGGGGSGSTAFSLGAGWFFTPRLQGRFNVGFLNDGDEGPQNQFIDVDTDNTQIGLSVRYRF